MGLTLSELLDVLDYRDGERLSLNYSKPGGAFRSKVVLFDDQQVDAQAAELAEGANCWFGVNPTGLMPGEDEGRRGKAEEIKRLAAVWADLDVKAGACRDLNHAWQLVAELSAIVGVRPSAVAMSGSGLHAYWPIGDGQIADTDPAVEAERRADAAALLRRFGRLVVLVGERYGAKLDGGVFDLARVLRVPGSYNFKGDPVLVTCERDTGAPLTLSELADRLDEAGVTECDGDRNIVAGDVRSATAEWCDAADTCAYADSMVNGWARENPTERHNWLVRQAVRIMAARRRGCLDAAGYEHACSAAVDTFTAACARDDRRIPNCEIPNAFAWATDRVSRMTDEQVRAELGDHEHPAEVNASIAELAGHTTDATDATDARDDGPDVLCAVRDFLGRFVAFPTEHAQIAYALWIAHTHLLDAWESTPRIAFMSPEPASGKTRALGVAEPLVPEPVHAVNCTPAYLFRRVGNPDGKPTILYDEIDTVFGPKAKDNEDIRGMLNAGHRKGAKAGRCVIRGKQVETEEIDAYAAVALAGLHHLPDTIGTRSIIVRMRRRKPDEKVEPWRRRVNEPEGKALGERLARWTATVTARAGQSWPDMPESITDRDADVWEPLLAVADLAGGSWPDLARAAAVAIVAESKGANVSRGVQLVTDIRRVFDEQNTDKLPTIQLVASLIRLEESPWANMRKGEPIDARGLADLLSDYGIASKFLRDERGANYRGYSRAQFIDTWERYLPSDDAEDDRDDDHHERTA